MLVCPGYNSNTAVCVFIFFQSHLFFLVFFLYYAYFCITSLPLFPLKVNLPRAVVIAISMVTGLYLLVNISYLTVMTPRELMSSSAVAVTWG